MPGSAEEISPRRLHWLLAALFGLPLLVVMLKSSGLPAADWLWQNDSLIHLPQRLQDKAFHILLIPLGAMLVVFFRLTLGIRVLGPFRSVLLAVAFQTTGIVPGLVFLALTVVIVTLARPQIRALKMPYFGRITVMLSGVAALLTLGLLSAEWFSFDLLRGIAFLPVVVLCLIGDAFARTIRTEGLRSAVWRAATTALIAVLLTLIAGVPQVKSLLLHYPELLVAQVGCIIVISKFAAFRVLKALNPHNGTDEEDELEESEDRKSAKLPVRADADLPVVIHVPACSEAATAAGRSR